MKIIIVNYRFFISGGPERYLFNIIKLLEGSGHEVIPFSVDNGNNVHSVYADNFLKPAGQCNYARDIKKNNLLTNIQMVCSMLYSFKTKRVFKQLIDAVKPDIIYVLHYKGVISPSIFDVAKKNRIPIVQRISDFSRFCANNNLFDYNTDSVCEKCIKGSKLNGVINKCSNNSYLNSLFKVSALYVEKFINLNEKTDSYVVPSAFTYNKLKEVNIPEEKLNLIPTFFDGDSDKIDNIQYKNFILYFGRVDRDKGVHLLVKAVKDIDTEVFIIGDSTDVNYYNYLKNISESYSQKVHFIPKLKFGELQEYIKNCLFVVVPSLWYDNFPNSVLEAYAFRKCVVASDLGSLEYMIDDKITGLRFFHNDVCDLSKKIKYLIANQEEAKMMGSKAFDKLQREYNKELHYSKLIELFKNAINKKKILHNYAR